MSNLFPGSTLTVARLRAIIEEFLGTPQDVAVVTATGTTQSRSLAAVAADTAVIDQFVSGLDNTGATDMSAKIIAAHDLAYAAGFRRLYFGRGDFLAANLTEGGVGNLIFVGPGRLLGAYRKHIIPEDAPSFAFPRHNVVPRQHLDRFLQAVDAGSAVVVCAGDSTTAGGDNERTVRRRMYDTFGPDADNITVLNYGVGGATWAYVTAANWAATGGTPGANPSWWTDDNASWESYIEAAAPDLVIWNFGQNGSSATVATAGMRDAVAAVEGYATRFGLRPDMLFQTPYAPSNVDDTKKSRSNQSRRLAVAGLTRTYCRRWGYGLIDIGQAASALRDGIDPLNSRLMRVQAAYDTSRALPYAFPQETTDFRLILAFANGKADLWDLGQLIIPLSSVAGNQIVLEKDGATSDVAVTVYAETGVVCRARTIVDFNTASTGALIFQITVKGGDAVVLSGSTIFLRAPVERYGDSYTPVISLSSGTPTVNINDLLLTEPVLSMPALTDVEQFGPQTPVDDQPADSGNGDNHMAGAGDELVLTQTYIATCFA